MTNDQPIHISLKLENEINVKDLITKICQIRECNIDSSLQKTELFLVLLNKNKEVICILNPDHRVNISVI